MIAKLRRPWPPDVWPLEPVILEGIPLLYEDEEEEFHDVGDAAYHTEATFIAYHGIRLHLGRLPGYRFFANFNLFYTPTDPRAYVSPDGMVVRPAVALPETIASYRIGVHGPAPVLALEVLSPRTAQQRDLDEKMQVYAQIGVPEYVIIDVTGHWLPERLVLKRLQPNRTWVDERDPDGGVTSQLGFRIILEEDGQVRVINARNRRRYPRPEEVGQVDKARQKAEKKAAQEEKGRLKAERLVQELQARLRELEAQQEAPSNPKPGRKKKR